MIEKFLQIIKDMYPNHTWEYESIHSNVDTIYHIKCDGQRIKVGYSETVAKKLSELNHVNAEEQILRILKLQIEDYFSKNVEKKEEKQGIY